ncbi:Bgr_08870 family protein [Bartonella gliris]|uniref:Bgr_08870 family protein n=1 Tax=Bartonella gliris TaxID=3004109 RepID=UPI00295E2219|nr:Bgr_08870 family protein [Bartonella gliris]
MEKTKKLQMELPKEGRFISSEFPILRENLTKIDQAIADVEEKVDEKAPSKHTHTISDVADLEVALKAKMAADKTFTLTDLGDVEGAKDAANNYVLYKASNNNFTFGSAISLLGAHQHKTDDIVGLDAFKAKINEDLTAYGRLKQANEWQNYNKFTNKVTISGDLELISNSSFSLTHNGEVVTRLNASGSLLKGPLKVDGEAVYTKSEIDKLVALLKKKPVEILMTQSGPIPFPEGVSDDTEIEICAWGGGGGGGGDGGNNNGGGGGGGGQYARVKVKGSDLKKSKTVQIGRGGKGGRSNGSYGGYTIIKGIICAGGGGYGGGNDNTPGGYTNAYGNRGNGGKGGLGGIGGGTWKKNDEDMKNESFIFSGGLGGAGGSNSDINGSHGGNSIYGGGGGGGGGKKNGKGGYGGNNGGGNGGDYGANGGGGGGGYFRGKDGSKIGGDGGDGAVLLRFFI